MIYLIFFKILNNKKEIGLNKFIALSYLQMTTIKKFNKLLYNRSKSFFEIRSTNFLWKFHIGIYYNLLVITKDGP